MRQRACRSQDPDRCEASANSRGFGLTEVTGRSGSEPAPGGKSPLWSRVIAVLLATLLLAAGVTLLSYNRSDITWVPPCRPNDLTCPVWWLAPGEDLGVFVWAVVGMAVDGISGRAYSSWLTGATVLLSMNLLVVLVIRGVL